MSQSDLRNKSDSNNVTVDLESVGQGEIVAGDGLDLFKTVSDVPDGDVNPIAERVDVPVSDTVWAAAERGALHTKQQVEIAGDGCRQAHSVSLPEGWKWSSRGTVIDSDGTEWVSVGWVRGVLIGDTRIERDANGQVRAVSREEGGDGE